MQSNNLTTKTPNTSNQTINNSTTKIPTSNTLTRYQKLKKFYVNLDSRTDRRQSTEAQVGTDFKRKSAIMGKELTSEQVQAKFDIPYGQRRYGITLTPGQMGCTISHYEIYQEVVNDPTISAEDWVLIAEDDNLFIPDFKQRLDQILKILEQPRFASLDILILRMSNFKSFVDQTEMHIYQGADRDKKLESLDGDSLKISFDSPGKEHIFSFNLEGLPTPPENARYSSNQSIMFAEFFSPYSSGLYLARKRFLVKLVARYPKPWWITDDFKSLTKLANIGLAMPMLGVDAEVAVNTDVQDSQAQQNTQNTRVWTKIDYSFMKFNKKWKNFYQWYYSTSKLKRKFAQLRLVFLYLLKDRKKF